MISGTAKADNTALDSSDFEAFDDLPVVLSATRLAQRIEDIPAAISIIDHRTIVASGARNIPDVLRLVPGIQVAQIDGSKMTVTYHGLSDRHAHNMQVLIDGRSIYEAAHGLVTWNDLPVDLEDIARIEVIRGPNAATYGANAFAATINIITFHPAEQNGIYTRISAGTSETDTFVLRSNVSATNSDHRVTLKFDETDGIETRYDNSHTGMISYRGDIQLNSRDALLLELGYSRGSREDGFGDPTDSSNIPFALDASFDVYQPQREINDEHYSGQIKWSRRYSSDEEISLQYFYSHQTIDDAFNTVTFSEYGGQDLLDLLDFTFGQPDQTLHLGYGTESNRHDLEFAHIVPLAGNWRLSWGAGARIDSATSHEMFGSNDAQTIYQFRLFANAEWIAQHWMVINAGSMVEKYENYSTQFSPRLAASFHINTNNTLRISVTDAYRMPTLIENYSNQFARFEDGSVFDYIDFGPGNLEPEEMRSYEIGYIFTAPDTGLNLDIKAFSDKLRNMIEIPKDHTCLEELNPGTSSITCESFDSITSGDYSGRYTYDNNGWADIQGIELGLMWNINNDTWLRGAYGFADIRHYFMTDLSPALSQTRDDQAPRNTWSLLLAHNFDYAIRGSLACYSLDETRWLEDGDKIPAYHRLDARLARHFRVGQDKGEIALIAQNMNNKYQDFQTENELRDRIFVELKIEFH
ncbi:MAG: iron complex outerrane recepter protein [Pseudomonadota bacterium]|nr:iron complex outerrane recepter protein [Pseudomonadota bacterium]